jgi:hypothetical protein
VTLSYELLARLGWYVAERQAIWQRRQSGAPRPWTTDSALANNHFTNVYRELDPGTIYAQHQLQQLESADKLWFAAAYRCINRRAVFEEYDGKFGSAHTEEWIEYLNERYATKRVVKTNRHLTPNRRLYEACLRSITEPIVRDPQDAWRQLMHIPAVGQFIGWQIHCDLVQCGAIDVDPTFVRAGDGAMYSIAVLYGLRRFEDYWHDGSAKQNTGRDRRIEGRVRASATNQMSFSAVIMWLIETQATWLPTWWISWNGQPLDAKNIEHSLCEWMRWERLSQ